MTRANLVETVLRAARSDPALSAGGHCVVAVSGGPDSTALLHALARSSGRLGVSLTAAHVDHGLREASRADGIAVAALCEALGVEFRTARLVIRGRSEEAARSGRHAFLAGLATELGAASVAYGHTADDQAETVMLHLVRGSGVAGLRAMSTREGLRFRPLLTVTRHDVLEHCRRHDLAFVEDESNVDPAFLRNRVRHEVIPLLRTLNPGVGAALVRLAEAAADEHRVIVDLAAEWRSRQPPGGLDRRSFAALPAAVAFEALRQEWELVAGVAGPVPSGGYRRLADAARLVADGQGREFAMPSGVRLLIGPTDFTLAGPVQPGFPREAG